MARDAAILQGPTEMPGASFLQDYWPYLLSLLDLAVAIFATGHVVLQKREVRAAIGWAGLIWLLPLLGALLYFLLGINRIQRRARKLRADQVQLNPPPGPHAVTEEYLSERLGSDARHLTSVARIVAETTGRALLAGNRITPLRNGDEAYPAMTAAIDAAQDSILLSTYIFDNDRAGRLFVEALGRAVARGIEARVLIDDVGAHYSWPSIRTALLKVGVRVAHFLPTWFPWLMPFSNLRNHRKLLVVDGRVGFTGGMNIREGCCLAWQPRHPVQDLHFRIEGPVVAHLQELAAEDWAFVTGEVLSGPRWFPPLDPAGSTLARGISDGPDEDFEKLRLTLLAAISGARKSILVATPYFLPDSALITALNLAAMRGVAVDLLLPEVNNLILVQWAATAQLWQVLEHGCRVWLTPPPFDHSKLMIVDEAWILFGSSNWDPRSLRLNFEFDLECYDPELSGRLAALLRSRRAEARSITLADVDGRSLPVRLRDGCARLLSPYL